MNKFFSCVLLIFFFINSALANDDSILRDVLKTGVLKVGVTGDWFPMTIKDIKNNNYSGYDIDVITELSKDLGVDVEFVPTDWKTLVNGILSKKYHITGSASVTPSRAKVAGYSKSYLSLTTVPIISKKDIPKYKSWEDLNNKDVKVAATLGTTHEIQIKELFPNSQHIIVESPARDFQEVLAGRADAHITSSIEAQRLIEKYNQLEIIPVDNPKYPTQVSMLLPQGDQIWINYINTWIDIKKEEGFFKELKNKWKILFYEWLGIIIIKKMERIYNEI